MTKEEATKVLNEIANKARYQATNNNEYFNIILIDLVVLLTNRDKDTK